MTPSGEWINERGSRIKLEADDDGSLRGTYHTEVGNAEGIYRLVGRHDTEGSEGGRSLTFCVCWENYELNSHSATAWAGQLQMDEDGDLITTMWLLTRETDQSDDWESTKAGQDVYRRASDKPWSGVSSHPMH